MSDGALEVLVRIAAEAATLVAEVYATPFVVDFKGPADPVTEADRRANDLIVERLTKEFPGVPIVAEESKPETFANFAASNEIFFVDPVDGTNEFIERNSEFVVMIGLLSGAAPTLGVMHAPALGIAWAGAVGKGAERILADGSRSPIRVSDTPELGQARLVSSRSHRSARLDHALAALGPREVYTKGSAGLKGTEVAEGFADAHVAPFYAGKRWDACAAEALILAAGGRVTDAYGAPLDYRGAGLSNDRGLVATNGRIHDAIVRKLEALRGS
ncbi:MAG TPA: 3'(2'),5'-bisphosphate nucleotidase CysQ [Polyangiaceae bacterium]|nr:3'(2'),5'-bisphosphate nucleotidase CysQ [Polyangiaceae bacterium]